MSVSGNWRIVFSFNADDASNVDLVDYHSGAIDMRMKNPPHPGLSVKHDCLEPLGLSVTDGAKALGVSRKALSALVIGHAGISPEMAVRLSKAFGGSPEAWINMQAYDLMIVMMTADAIKVDRVPLPDTA